jgi:hypothetical protein
VFAQKGSLKSGTNWVASWGSVQNVGWISCQFVLISVLQMVLGQWHGGVLSKIQLGCHMKGDQRKGLKKIQGNYNFYVHRLLMIQVTTIYQTQLCGKMQDIQCKLAMANLPSNCILSHIDFTEKYTLQI